MTNLLRSCSFPHSPKVEDSALDRLKCHLLGCASGLVFPLRKQRCIILRDVLLASNPQSLRGRIDPARLSLDLAEIADGRMIHDYLPLAVGPFGAKFLVAE